MTPQTQTSPQQQKPAWDTRAWLLGILGGTVGGSLASWTTYAPVHNWLNRVPFSLFHITFATVVGQFSLFLTLLALPGLLSGLARRGTFLWGLLPLSLLLVSVDLEEWVENGLRSATKDWGISLAIIGGCWVVSSGPVSLIRWLRVRAARRHETLMASYQAQRGAASGQQEGVWPPPPEYRE